MTVAGMGANTMVAGAAMNAESTAADHEFRTTISQLGDEPSASFRMDLPDGIQCSDGADQELEPTTVNIIDSESRSFRAEISGTLHCGPGRDQTIAFTAYLNADP